MPNPGPSAVAPAQSADELFCPSCGYNLRGTSSDRCAECGTVIDRSLLGQVRIPWFHRRRIGRWRAYWRTVALVTFRTKDFASEISRPVSYRDAQRFRWLTVVLAWFPISVPLCFPPLLNQLFEWGRKVPNLPYSRPSGWMLDGLLPFAVGATIPGVLPLALLICLAAVTGVASYFFHPRHEPIVRQNRAIALSHYACAPLAVTLLPTILWLIVLFGDTHYSWQRAFWNWFMLATLLGVCIPALQVLAWWLISLRLLKHGIQSSTARRISFAIALPLIWLLLAAVILLGVPWIVGFVALVLASFG